MGIDPEKLKNLHIAPEAKHRPSGALWGIFCLVAVVTGAAVFFAWPREADAHRVFNGGSHPATNNPPVAAAKSATTPTAAPAAAPATPSAPGANNATPTATPGGKEVVLTVSGHIINRERIALSPRFMGTVAWIGVKKGDPVTNGQVVVRLDDAEYRARLHEVEGRAAMARAAVERARLDHDRMVVLARSHTESQKSEDDARLQLQSAEAALKEIEGSREVAQTYLDWTVIRSPIDGVVLEKLVQPYELVVPQSFGGSRGPSTALIAVADPKDLQVEVDVNESDLSKITMGQACRLSPEAYGDRSYVGRVAEIAPEADRQKGTLQIKVQILQPDRYLTPQLMARVDFLAP